MGNVIAEMVEEDDNAVIVAGIDVSKSKEERFPVYYSFVQCNVPADVIIDFSSPVNVREMLDYAIKRKIGIVLCTTGFSKEDQRPLSSYLF
jgi:4-hydroxy-tetrahydrodipicolinate reductase